MAMFSCARYGCPRCPPSSLWLVSRADRTCGSGYLHTRTMGADGSSRPRVWGFELTVQGVGGFNAHASCIFKPHLVQLYAEVKSRCVSLALGSVRGSSARRLSPSDAVVRVAHCSLSYWKSKFRQISRGLRAREDGGDERRIHGDSRDRPTLDASVGDRQDYVSPQSEFSFCRNSA